MDKLQRRKFGNSHVYDLGTSNLKQVLRQTFHSHQCQFEQFTEAKSRILQETEYYTTNYKCNAEDCYMLLTMIGDKKCCFVYFQDGDISLMKVYGGKELYNKDTIIYGRLSTDSNNKTTLRMIDVLVLCGVNAYAHFTLHERTTVLHCIKLKIEDNHQLAVNIQIVEWERCTSSLDLAVFIGSTILLYPIISTDRFSNYIL